MRATKEKIKIIESPEKFELSSENLAALNSFVHTWRCSVPSESTWVQKKLGVPSLFIRVEAVIKNGLNVINVIGNPTGLGLLKERHNRFYQVLQDCAWPNFRVLADPDINLGSDQLWLRPISEEEAARSDDLLIIRSNNGLVRRFANRSVMMTGDNFQPLINEVNEKNIINLPLFRLFFLYNLPAKEYRYAGGFWRKKLRNGQVEIGLVD